MARVHLMVVSMIAASAFEASDGRAAQGDPTQLLFGAVAKGDRSAVEAALAQGAAIDVTHFSGGEGALAVTPLGLAVALGDAPVRDLLVSRGADPSAADGIAFVAAVMTVQPQAVTALLAASGGKPPRGILLLSVLASRPTAEFVPLWREHLRAEFLPSAPQPPPDVPWSVVGPDWAASPDDPALQIARALVAAGCDAAGVDARAVGEDTPLALAVDAGDVFLARVLAEHGATLPSGRRLDADLLVSASRAGNVAGVAALLDAGASPAKPDYEGHLALPEAVASLAGAPLAALLMAHDAPPARVGPGQTAPLATAAGRGLLETVGRLLDAGAPPGRAESGWPLREAVRGGWVDVTTRLLRAKASPNERAGDGGTLLHRFSSDGGAYAGAGARPITPAHVAAIRAVGTAGFDFAARDRSGETALASECHAGGDATVRDAFVQAGAHPDLSTLSVAVQERNEPLLQWLVAHGGDAAARPPEGARLFEEAMISVATTPGLAAALLRAGVALPPSADVRIQYWFQALRNATAPLVKAFLDRGLDPNAADLSVTPLDAALASGHADVVRLLASAGADTAAKDDAGQTALHRLVRDDVGRKADAPRAIGPAQEEAIAALVESGFDPGLRDAAGRTAIDLARGTPTEAAVARAFARANVAGSELHLAIRRNDEARVTELLAGGADLEKLDEFRRSPLTVALELRRNSIARLLLKRGATFTLEPRDPTQDADVDHASDPDLAAAFQARLLSTKLLDVAPFHGPHTTAAAIAAYEANRAVVPADVRWTVHGGPMTFDAELRGNQRIELVALASEREDEGRQSWFRLMQYNVAPVEFGLPFGPRNARAEFVYDATGTLELPACPFDLIANPTCAPGVAIETASDPHLTVTTRSGPEPLPATTLQYTQAGLVQRLAPGGRVVLDRSAGPIALSIGPIHAKSFSIAVRVTMVDGSSVEVSPKLDDPVRVATYARVAVLAARMRALEGGTTQSENVAAEAKSIAAAIHVLTAKCVERYRELVRVRLKSRAEDIARASDSALAVRNAVVASNAMTAGEIDALIARIDALMLVATGADATSLARIRDGLVDARAAAAGTHSAVALLRDRFFTDLDRIIAEYQGLVLEFAQYYSDAALAREADIDPSWIDAIRKKVTPADVVVRDDALGGRGVAIRAAFGLATPP